MTEPMKERCLRICGKDSRQCFIHDREQIECIADMVINKIFPIQTLIELMEESAYEPSAVREYLAKAKGNIHELTNWIKFLQIATDLQELGILDYERLTEERRQETRYPFPEIYRQYIGLQVNISGLFVRVNIINFSEHGLKFTSPGPLAVGSWADCVLVAEHPSHKEVFFKIGIRYCSEDNGGFSIGAQVEEVPDASTFNFFRNVYDFIIATGRRY